MAAMARYVLAATLARGANSGAAIGLLLLATETIRGPHAIAIGGLLAAGLTAPHALGPWVARHLDKSRDGRLFLAASFVGYGVALAAAGLAVGRVGIPVVLLLVVVAGACGPLLTGGLSSRVAGIAGPGEREQRRAEGWDSVSYGLSGTLGPAAVAGFAAVTSALAAVLALAAAAVLAAAITLTLPREASRERREVVSVREVLRLLVRHGPLRRVNVGTLATSFSLGGMPVVAVVLAGHLTDQAGAGATLVAAFGVGSLAGSLAVTAFPLHGSPDILTTRHVALLGVAAALCALAPNYPLALVAFALVGVANAPFVTATFAARSTYAPPDARAQVFVSMSSLKVATAAAGSALTGVATFLGPRGLPAATAIVVLLGALTCVVDRRLEAKPT
ncbi:putative MFS family arabinose efflux permease [Actinophytocola oryzae]|uniref:Putative MFS family arabinose efflux permease n=2 Tax=Actinophytocola oryzae TaxID=502181 RepID=A0A4R7UYA8_9PSEU|nr:putative MFS family arabinose efflux permease [Actinophytocola oryzae]